MTTTDAAPKLEWYRVLGVDELPEGRVTTVVAQERALALTHFEGAYAALENSLSPPGRAARRGLHRAALAALPLARLRLRPAHRRAPGGFTDSATTLPVEVRADGIYVGMPPPAPHRTTIADILAETMSNWGVTHTFGMVGASNLGLGDALRRLEADGRMTYIGVRHEGSAAFAASAYAKLTGRPAACLAIAGPGATNLMTGIWDAKMDPAPPCSPSPARSAPR